MTLHLIGIEPEGDGHTAIGSEKTKAQIAAVCALRCDLIGDGEHLTWLMFDDPAESRTLFQAILKDRAIRIDKRTCMADRPPFAVVTEEAGTAVRLEYYEGHDGLSLVYDIRSAALQGADLKPWRGNE